MCVPSDFLLNADAIDAFWKTYYPNGAPRIVSCGGNHDSHGVGQTGIAFIDFCSLQQLLPGIQRQDHEKSASYFFRVIQAFGSNEFFLNFYVTHGSSIGFSNGDARALNYYDLPEEMLQKIESNFFWKMEIVQPTRVVSLGTRVHETARRLLPARIDYSSYLPDPNWVATFKSHPLDDWMTG